MYRYPNRLPDETFDIAEIRNQKELLSKIYDIHLPIEFNEEDRKFWDRLINIFANDKDGSLDEIIKKIFRVTGIDKDNVLKLLIDTDDEFKKWLLKQYIISKTEWKDTYIYHVISAVERVDNRDLEEVLWLKIFDMDNKLPLLCEERNLLLKQFYADKEPPAYFEERLESKINSISDNKEKLKLITGIARCEQNILLRMFINQEIEAHHLQDRYEGLYYYIQDTIPDNLPEDVVWLKDYFKEYRLSKLRDAISPVLNNMLIEKNKNKDTFYKWYYSFETANQILQKENVSRVIWIDALGIEWLPMLINIIRNEFGFFVNKKYVARANLPTITECNRFEGALYIRDLDRDVHSREPYKYPDSIIKDIGLIKKILQKNLTISIGEKVAIVSDHGSTAMARLKENQKIYDFKEAHHDGRCMWVNNNDFLDDNGLLLHDIDNPNCNSSSKALIALQYTSLYRKPIREVHGGATPEEVLVPVIIITRGDMILHKYTISPVNCRLNRKDPILWVSINPLSEEVPILIAKKMPHIKIKMEFIEPQHQWRANLKAFKVGKYEVIIKIGDFEKVINIDISGGMQEDELI